MSPRAAWRLEELGFKQVYDSRPRQDRMAGDGVVPREGKAAAFPNAGEIARRDTPRRAHNL
jgi:hypothetical protein